MTRESTSRADDSRTTRPAVLVAGGAGYIGSHTAKVLSQSGFTPVVLDNLSTGYRDAVRFGPFFEVDITDTHRIAEIIAEYRPVGAILVAGYIAVGESTGDPRKYYDNNVAGALSFLNVLVDASVRNVVFSSSAAVYGLQERVPIPEDSPLDPLSPYAESKLFIEQVLRWYASAHGVSSASLRYFNAAGADPEGGLGERHSPETHLIPLAIQAAMGGKPLSIFGTDYPTPDGTAIRDYIHVTDLAAGHLLSLRHLMNTPEPLALKLNLGTGQGHSVKEVIQSVERIGGVKVPASYGPRREGDAPALVADSSAARSLLGWTPRYSDLDTIVRTAWAWHRSHAECEPLSSA